jgi:hypothetical protein
MTIISISEASRLTGKDRRTIQRHIAAGKLSRAADGKGIDTSELLRVYGAFVAAPAAASQTETLPQKTAPIAAPAAEEKDIKIMKLEAEIEKLQAVLQVKNEHIESMNKAMLILEHKQEQPASQEVKKEGVFTRLFRK